MATTQEYEKGTLERIETRSDAETPATQKHNPLDKVETHETLAAVDIENHQAFKGDDSDGKVHWTFKKLLAAAFLSMLYTGKQSSVTKRNAMLTMGIQALKFLFISLAAP